MGQHSLTESRAAIAELVEEGILESLTVRDEAGEEFILHADPTVRPRTTREHAAYLLPTFDEVTLTHARTGFPLARATLDRSRPIAEAGGGTVVIGVSTSDCGSAPSRVARSRSRSTRSGRSPNPSAMPSTRPLRG